MSLTTTMHQVKVTKRTVRYEETAEGPLTNMGNPGTLYIPQASLPQPFPQTIVVTVEVVVPEVEVANTL